MTDPSAAALREKLVRAGLLCGVVDGLWAIALTLAYQGTILRLWQGVAAVPFGPAMREGGIATAALGVLVHFGVAFAWSGVFVLAYAKLGGLRRAIASRPGALLTACVYGPLIWIVMSLAVLPALTQAEPTVTVRWWIQLAGHALFVGPPIVWGVRS
jgi:hypothetical protein